MKYDIISTGSKGNAVVIEDKILIDCGVNYKALKPYVPCLQLVLLTHEHGDHFYPSCIKTLARERPTLRFGCCKWLYKNLLAVGVNRRNIDIYTPDTVNDYKKFKIEWFDLLAVQGTFRSLLQHHSLKASILWCSAFSTVHLSQLNVTTGKTEGRRKRGRQRTRWFDGITDSMDMSLSKL